MRVVNRHKLHRNARASRLRYFLVWCAVWLAVCVPTTARPLRPAMERRGPRAASRENELWANPCDYNDSISSSPLKYSPRLAKEVASQARSALKSAADYKDKFALKLHSYPSFDELLQEWNGYEWLRKFPWHRDEVLPRDKALYQSVPDEYLDQLMENIDDVLPGMYKSLKVVVAGLHAIASDGLSDAVSSDETLRGDIVRSVHDVRAVLCLFNDIMTSKNLIKMPLTDAEVPDFKTEDKLSVALLVYRDTINYLEYLAQVFQKMYDYESDKSA